MTLLHPLIRAHVYVLRDDRPVFIRTIVEGDIAFHGFRLKASRCSELANDLCELNSNGLWEYNRGFGVTMEDSALVIDGLIDAGWDTDALKNFIPSFMGVLNTGSALPLRPMRLLYTSLRSLISVLSLRLKKMH